MSVKQNYRMLKHRKDTFFNSMSYTLFDGSKQIKPIYLVFVVLLFPISLGIWIWPFFRYLIILAVVLYVLRKIFIRVKAEITYRFSYIRKNNEEGFVYESRITDPPIRRK